MKNLWVILLLMWSLFCSDPVSSTPIMAPFGNYSSPGSANLGTSVAFTSTSFIVVGQTGNNTVNVLNCASGSCILEYSFSGSDSVSGDQFGFSVAVSGSYVAVGAPGRSGGGAVYFFNTTEFTHTQLVKVTSVAEGNFGYSVGLLGTTIVVGSPSATPAGNATVLDCSAGSSCVTHYLPAISTGLTAGENFGSSVSIASAGFIAIGASGNNGAVYLYNCTAYPCVIGFAISGTLLSEGSAVSVSGLTMLVGIPASNLVYYFTCVSAATCNAPITIAPSGGLLTDQFGASVSLFGTFAVIGSLSANGGAGRIDYFNLTAGSGPAILSNVSASNTV